MTDLGRYIDSILTEKLHMGQNMAGATGLVITAAAVIVSCIAINWLCQNAYRWISGHSERVRSSKWHPYISQRKIGHHIMLIIPGIAAYFLPYLVYTEGSRPVRLLHRADIIYMLIVLIMIANSILLASLDAYSNSDKSRRHPISSVIQALQVMLYFVGGIIIVAVLINKSPAVLLTGLGASAAVLMLIFKDSILGFVAGVQLSQNDMVRIGDWIQMPDGSANGNVEEITLNTVKVRNWDNTISMIPPYTLISSPFKNWRGMLDGQGRRADKCIFIDLTSLETCSEDMVKDLCKGIPLLDAETLYKEGRTVTNIEIFRTYIETFLKQHPDVNQEMDIIVTQKEATAYGLPVEVYFFVRDKAWASYERKQSDIFDHLMVMVPEFGLKLYQRP